MHPKLLFVFTYTACLVGLTGVISNSTEQSHLRSNNRRQETKAQRKQQVKQFDLKYD